MADIYVVEDDVNISEIESIALQNSGHRVETFENAKLFFERLSVMRPELIILDIMLPDEDGLEILRKLRSKPDTRRIPVILISAKSTEIDKVKGLELGADDYLTKPFGVMELIARVKALLRRTEEERKISGKEKYIHMGDVFIDDVRRVVSVANEKCELTYKEYELLKLLIFNEGIVLTRDVIMEKVWGIEFESESRTVDMHIKTLRQKLGASGNMIKTVRNVGYVAEL